MSEEKLWRKVNPGGETKRVIDRTAAKDASYDKEKALDELGQELEKTRRLAARRLGVKEVAKSLEETEFIGIVQLALMQERERLGLPQGPYLQSERVRVVDPVIWQKIHSISGRYLDEIDRAEVEGPSKDKNPFGHFAITSHELIHQVSYFETNPAIGQNVYRLGYRMRDGRGVGLDEAVTEGFNQELLTQHSGLLTKRFGTPRDRAGNPRRTWAEQQPMYVDYQAVTKEICRTVDKYLYNGKPTIWDNLKRGHQGGVGHALSEIKVVLGNNVYPLFMAMGNPNFFDLKACMKDYPTMGGSNAAWRLISARINMYCSPSADADEKKVPLDHIVRYMWKSPDLLKTEGE